MSEHAVSVDALIEQWTEDPDFRKEYERLEPSFELASCRIKLGMSERQFARWLGISKRRLRKLEDGTCSPRGTGRGGQS